MLSISQSVWKVQELESSVDVFKEFAIVKRLLLSFVIMRVKSIQIVPVVTGLEYQLA